MTNKPVMGDQTPLTKRAVDEAWEKLPTSDHRLGYMISFAQLLEEKLTRLTPPEGAVDTKALQADLYTMETNLLMGNIGQAREIIERIRTYCLPQREEVK